MTQDEIRQTLSANPAVYMQIAGPGDGSPEVAWGDTFFYVRGQDGKPKKIPFTTIVTKDYDGFDSGSQLNRAGSFRLNMEVGRPQFEKLFGFGPAASPQERTKFDCAVPDRFFPHPHYGAQGWVSIVNPSDQSRATVADLLQVSLRRALESASA